MIELSVPNCLDPDQDRHSVGPDLGPNCLQSLKGISRRKVATRKEIVNQKAMQ